MNFVWSVEVMFDPEPDSTPGRHFWDGVCFLSRHEDETVYASVFVGFTKCVLLRTWCAQCAMYCGWVAGLTGKRRGTTMRQNWGKIEAARIFHLFNWNYLHNQHCRHHQSDKTGRKEFDCFFKAPTAEWKKWEGVNYSSALHSGQSWHGNVTFGLLTHRGRQ